MFHHVAFTLGGDGAIVLLVVVLYTVPALLSFSITHIAFKTLTVVGDGSI